MYLIFLGILADRCGSVVVMERDCDTKGPSLTLGCDLLSCEWKQSQLVSITSQNFLIVLKMAATVYEKEICGGWLGSSQIECFLCLVTSIITD